MMESGNRTSFMEIKNSYEMLKVKKSKITKISKQKEIKIIRRLYIIQITNTIEI